MSSDPSKANLLLRSHRRSAAYLARKNCSALLLICFGIGLSLISGQLTHAQPGPNESRTDENNSPARAQPYPSPRMTLRVKSSTAKTPAGMPEYFGVRAPSEPESPVISNSWRSKSISPSTAAPTAGAAEVKNHRDTRVTRKKASDDAARARAARDLNAFGTDPPSQRIIPSSASHEAALAAASKAAAAALKSANSIPPATGAANTPAATAPQPPATTVQAAATAHEAAAATQRVATSIPPPTATGAAAAAAAAAAAPAGAAAALKPPGPPGPPPAAPALQQSAASAPGATAGDQPAPAAAPAGATALKPPGPPGPPPAAPALQQSAVSAPGATTGDQPAPAAAAAKSLSGAQLPGSRNLLSSTSPHPPIVAAAGGGGAATTANPATANTATLQQTATSAQGAATDPFGALPRSNGVALGGGGINSATTSAAPPPAATAPKPPTAAPPPVRSGVAVTVNPVQAAAPPAAPSAAGGKRQTFADVVLAAQKAAAGNAGATSSTGSDGEPASRTITNRGGPCGTADQLGYNCSSVQSGAQYMQTMAMVGTLGGQVATQVGGANVMNNAMSATTQGQQDIMRQSGELAKNTGIASLSLGTITAAGAALTLLRARNLSNDAKSLDAVSSMQANEMKSGPEQRSLGGYITGYADPRGALDKIKTKERDIDAELNSKNQAIANSAANHIRSTASQAAQENRAAASAAMMPGVMMLMQGLQQITSGNMQRMQGQMMIDQANRPVPIPTTGGFNVPYSTNPAGGSVVAGGPTAITGDGSNPSTPDESAATLSSTPPPGLGDPINPNPLPSGPTGGPAPGQFNVGNNQDQGAQGGGGAGMGGESTAPADMSQSGATQPTAAPQDVAGANYVSSGALAQGGGSGGGRGGAQDNGDINMNSALGALLAGMKKDEPNDPKTDIRFFGGGDQNMSAIPYTPYGKEADLMKRVSDRIRFEHQTGRIGG